MRKAERLYSIAYYQNISYAAYAIAFGDLPSASFSGFDEMSGRPVFSLAQLSRPAEPLFDNQPDQQRSAKRETR